MDSAGDLGPEAVLAVADGARLRLGEALLKRLAGSRGRTLTALAGGGPVYGVTTGLGSQAGLSVGAAEQPGFQGDLMLARSVGTAPWLGLRSVRAATATRLRTLLDDEAGASPQLAVALAALLSSPLHPAVPATGYGAAGEIIPLAHLGGFLSGTGDGLDETGVTAPAAELLRTAGLDAYAFGPREGVTFLQGVPVATAEAVLLGHDCRVLAAQALAVAAAGIVRVRAPRDPYDAALGRGDPELTRVLAALRSLAGPEPRPRMLQAPVSFRVVGPALAHLERRVEDLSESVRRVLVGVTTSPALIEGRFLGTAGFDGFDLAASADALRVAVLHLAELATARLHRLLDPRVSGLTAQLSAEPGRQAGVVALHKRAVGLVHDARRQSGPVSLGATDTSLGQEDAQGFALDATAAARRAAQVLRDVIACELVALGQAAALDPDVAAPTGSPRLQSLLDEVWRHRPATTTDRPWGRDVQSVTHDLSGGWAYDILLATRAVPVAPPSPTP